MAALVLDHCVFLHVPKTGGTWVTSALREQGLVRATIHTADGADHPTAATVAAVTSLPIIASVREPVSWLQSYWCFFHVRAWRPSQRGPIPCLDTLMDLTAPDFQTFAARYLSRRPGYVTELLRSYVDGAAHVCRQERLLQDLRDALSQCEQPINAEMLMRRPPENVSRPFDVTCLPETAAQIREADRWVIDQFYPDLLPT